MLDLLESLSLRLGVSSQSLLILGIGIGVALLSLGLAAIWTERNPAAIRMAETRSKGRRAHLDHGILRPAHKDPRGLMKSIMPTKAAERTALHIQLAQAGFPGQNALRNFMLVRIGFGLMLPGFMILLIMIAKMPGVVLPFDASSRIASLTNLQILQALTILVSVGYFGPKLWLSSRVKERQLRIEETFPNGLDLMQISVEAGLGFDAAMTRVGNELSRVSPDISFEFLSVQRQVQAGRAREAAMQDMAARTGVEMVRSFAMVVQQSMQFGTSMSDALTTYAIEMRSYREMRAQEMANKLPVKMSAVLASLMLPALLLLTLGPVVIRYIRFYG
jgi:tight adherence protein C